VTPSYAALELAARHLLAALDRQHGGGPFSLNVTDAREALRRLVPPERDERDRAAT
jgi:hypothetical protein